MSTIKHLLCLLPCIVLLSGCHQYGILVKRESEMNCPTDIRKTVPWCAGEDAIFSCPCGPNEQFHGHKPTCWRLWQTSGEEWRDMHCQPLETRTEVEVPESISTEYIPLPIVDSVDESEGSEEDPELAKPEAEDSSSDEEQPSSDEESLPKPDEDTPQPLKTPREETSYQDFPKLPWEEEGNRLSDSPVINSLHQQIQAGNQKEIFTDLEDNTLLTNPSQQVIFREEAEPLKPLPPVEQTTQSAQLPNVPIHKAMPMQVLPSEFLVGDRVLESRSKDPVKNATKEDISVRLVPTEVKDSLVTEQPVGNQKALAEKMPVDSSLKKGPETVRKTEALKPPLTAQPAQKTTGSLPARNSTARKTRRKIPLRFQADKTPLGNSKKTRNPASMFVR